MNSMVKKIASRLVLILISLEGSEASEEDVVIYRYGLESLIIKFLHIFTIVLVGIIFKRVYEIILFIVSYSSIRVVAGGHHFNNPYICYLSSCFLGVSVLLGDYALSFIMKEKLFIIMVIFSFAIIVWFAPCKTENKPINNVERKLFKRKSIITAFVLEIIAFFLFKLEIISFSFVIMQSLTIESFGILYVNLAHVISKSYLIKSRNKLREHNRLI